ncbi:MAG TPA: hypothetical protein VK610_08020 [Rhodothermales bacterium]|nr:hypothetical protein [Rhodothermales bacterium]
MADLSALPLSVLVVAPDAGPSGEPADRPGAALEGPGVTVTRCGTLAEARALLAAAIFDVVCVLPHLPDGEGQTLEPPGRDVPVLVLAEGAGAPDARTLSPDATADDLRRALAPGASVATPPGPADGDAPTGHGDAAQAWALVDALRREVGRVVHAANNPLTVIAGNAQFLLEMARAGAVEPELARALEDIDAAGRRLQEELAALSAVRQRLATALASGDSLV